MKTYLPEKCEILPRWRIRFPRFFENAHAWLLGMGDPEVTFLKLFPAVFNLEHRLTPTPPGTFMAQSAIWLLWWETGVIFNRVLNAFYVQAIIFEAKSPHPQGAFHTVKEITYIHI